MLVPTKEIIQFPQTAATMAMKNVDVEAQESSILVKSSLFFYFPTFAMGRTNYLLVNDA